MDRELNAKKIVDCFGFFSKIHTEIYCKYMFEHQQPGPYKLNTVNGRDDSGLQKFKDLLQKIKDYGTGKRRPKPRKILIATDADACLFRGTVSHWTGYVGLGIMSDMVYVYRNIFKLCEQAKIDCDFCFLSCILPSHCHPLFEQQLTNRLGKKSDGTKFITIESQKFVSSLSSGGNNPHEIFNKKMFSNQEDGGEGYKDTEVLYFDNDNDHKVTSFRNNLNSQLEDVQRISGSKPKFSIEFPINIIHTEDVPNWLNDENGLEDFKKEYLKILYNVNQDEKNNVEQKDYDSLVERTQLRMEQKTGENYGHSYNTDGLKIDAMLKATQEALFGNDRQSINKQNEIIEKNFTLDQQLAKCLFRKFGTRLSAENSPDYNNYNKLVKDIENDKSIKSIINSYPDMDKLLSNNRNTNVNNSSQKYHSQMFPSYTGRNDNANTNQTINANNTAQLIFNYNSNKYNNQTSNINENINIQQGLREQQRQQTQVPYCKTYYSASELPEVGSRGLYARSPSEIYNILRKDEKNNGLYKVHDGIGWFVSNYPIYRDGDNLITLGETKYVGSQADF